MRIVAFPPLRCNYNRLERYRFVHVLSGLSVMDSRKGSQQDTSGINRRNRVQTWRPVSSQPFREGDGECGKQQSQLHEEKHPTSATISTSFLEKDNLQDLDNIAGPSTSRKEIGVDEGLGPHEKHSVSLEVGCSLMRFIKGKRGATQQELQLENGVNIIFPISRKDDVLVIEGMSIESVSNASKQVQNIIHKAVNSRDVDYSHFISLPLAVHPGLVDRLFDFQSKILGITNSKEDDEMGGNNSDTEDESLHPVQTSNISNELNAENKNAHNELKAEGADSHLKATISDIYPVSYPPKASKATAKEESSSECRENLGIDKSIFINPKTFHLTVLMLKLWNKERVKTAAEVLQSVSSNVLEALGNRPISIRLKGLECMKGSLAKARVLYAPVEEVGDEGRLLKACQVIIDAYVEAGLVMERDAQNKLKFHATVMNVRHRKSSFRQWGRRHFDDFDARGIFQLYGSEEWGEYQIHEAHLSQRFAFGEDGYYHCCGSIPFAP